MSAHVAKTRIAALLATVAIAPLAPMHIAFAQDGDTVEREKIVVTARRRVETLQDTPLAVSAYSAADLEAVGAADITALNKTVPNVTIEVSRGTNSTLTTFIRGVGQQDPLWGLQQGVGLYVDDVYFARPQAAVLDIFDIERLEVLRGPQGTLYGRNTIGGAIKYVTRRIGGETAASARLNIGSYGQADVIVSGSAPLSDTFAVGGAIARYHRDGYGKNVFTGAEHYNKDVVAGRISAEWTPSDTLFFRLAVDVTDDDSNAKHGYRLLPGVTNLEPVLDSIYDTRAGLGDDNDIQSRGASLQGEWILNDNVTVKSITGYRDDETVTPIDFDGLPIADFDVPAWYENDQFSQEFQLLFNAGSWSGVAGVYYLDSNAAGAFDAALANLLGGFTTYTFGDVNTKSKSVFADVTYDFTNRWSFSLGGRYTEDENTSVVLRQNYVGVFSPFFGNPLAVPFGAPRSDYTGSRKDHKFSPRASVSFRPNEDLSFYASYSQGFKSGGFDPRGDSSTNPLVEDGFGPELVDSYEIGMKGDFLDNRLTLNTAVFFADYTDQQITVQQGIDTDMPPDGINDTFVSSVFNAGSSEYVGVEVEGVAWLTDGLSATFAIGWIDAEIQEIISAGVNIADQFVVQNTPEWTGHLALNQRFDMGDMGDLNVTLSASYRDEYHLFNVPLSGSGPTAGFPGGGPKIDPDANTLIDLSAVWSVNDHWSLGVHGKNLTDEEYAIAAYNFAFPAAAQLGADSSYTAFYGPPRTITATLAYRY